VAADAEGDPPREADVVEQLRLLEHAR